MRRLPTFAFAAVGSGLLLAQPGCSRATGAPAAGGVLTVEVGERFAFHPGRLHCRAGQPVRLRLSFRLPAAGSELMHNIAVLEAGTDPEAFGRAAAEATAADEYVPQEFRARVIALSPFARDGETREAVFTAPLAPGEYPIVCTFPGHCLLGMKGALVVQ